MSARAVLALDQGTTSSRALLFADDARVLAKEQREFEQHFPRPGEVEHDAEEIFTTQRAVAEAALAEAGLTAGEIAAIGITNQRETTVLWDRATGRPLAPAIVWQDRRTAALCAELERAGHGALVTERTGLRLDPYFSGTKLRWLLDAIPGARERAEAGELAFGTIDSWLVWKLTGGRLHATDASNASRTLLYDIHEGRWDPELLELLQIPAPLLPEVRDSSGDYGTVAIGDSPLDGIAIRGVAGDQQAALFGQGCFDSGSAKNTYGTGCFLLMQTGSRAVASKHGLLTTVAWQLDGERSYALEGSVFTGGAVIQWLRDGLGLIESAAEVEALAGSVADSGGVVLVPAFSGLGARHWDPYARGTLLGLTRGSGRAEIARAALESIALQSHDVLRLMERESGLPMSELRVDGGAAANDLLLQIQADLLQVSVGRPANLETTALGAAALAGLAAGFWPSTDALADTLRIERSFSPARASGEIAPILERWTRGVERARRWESEG